MNSSFKMYNSETGSMQGWWKQITLADFGDITEEHACDIALSTLALTGY